MRPGFDCAITAGFLDSGRTLGGVANAAAVMAGVGYWYEGPGVSATTLAISLLFWIVETWFAVRVRIDGSLFRTLAEDPEAGADRLDTLLVDWKLAKAPKSPKMTGRCMSDRSRGALRLLRLQWVTLVLQLVTLSVAMVLRAVNL